jgi:SAM-dependent methyltransferase
MGRWSRLVAPEFLDWLDLPDGLRWADIGCGSGALAAAVLERCSPRSVLGVDPSAAQVEEARRRVVDQRAGFVRGTADDLPAGSFDVVVSGLVLNFVPDPVAAVAAMARTAPGGLVAAYVWDYVQGMQLLRTFWDAARSLDPAAAPLDEGHRFSWCSPGELTAVLTLGGLEGVVATDLVVPLEFEDFADYWLPFLGGQGPAPAYVATLAPQARALLRAALERTLSPGLDGRISLTARAWAVRGRAQVSPAVV